MAHGKDLRGQAVLLRKQGLSYGEILKRIPVAKSTLSEWLHAVGLSTHQKQRLTAMKLLSAMRGGRAKHDQRVALTKTIVEGACREIGAVSRRELWLIGIALYWAEGSKEKEKHPGSGVQFTNSDGRMVQLFLLWLRNACGIGIETVAIDITVHENNKHRLSEIIAYWSQKTGLPASHFTRIYWKRHDPKTKRSNIGQSYYGTVKVKVRKSSILNRRIAGWVQGICATWGMV